MKRDDHRQRLAQELWDTEKNKTKQNTNTFSLEHLLGGNGAESIRKPLVCLEFALGLARQTNPKVLTV